MMDDFQERFPAFAAAERAFDETLWWSQIVQQLTKALEKCQAENERLRQEK